MTTPLRPKLGRKPNSGKPRVYLTAGHVPTHYTPPPTLDRYSAISADSWGMDGNGPDPTNPPDVPDGAGDCTIADVDHETKLVEVAAGNAEVSSTATEALAGYSAVTGFNPADPSTDQGAEMQDVRSYWQKTGFRLGGTTHKILLFAELHQQDTDLIKWALDQFGAIGLGINFPVSAMDQFNAGEPWDVVKDAQIEGGHAIALVGYDTDFWYVVTWGQVQKVTPKFFAEYVGEAWAALTAEFVNSITGEDPLRGTLYDLGSQFAAVTGKANPVPAPAPTPRPEPTPVPDPAPLPADVDAVFAAVLHPWVAERHVGENLRVKHQAQAWLAARGL